MPSSNTVPFRFATSPRLCERLEVEMMSIACSCDKQIRNEGCITLALFPRADIDDLMRATLIMDSARGTHRTGLRIVASARVSKCHDHKSLDVHRDGVLKLHDLDVQSGEPEEPFSFSAAAAHYYDFVLLVSPATSAGISLYLHASLRSLHVHL